MTTKHYNQELVEGLENYFLVATAECVITGALQRTESRGAHFREDYPELDNENWLEHLVLRKGDQQLQIERIPVDLGEIHPGEEGD